MKIVVGLGNPGKKFEESRHNVGFLVIDKLKSQIRNPKSEILNNIKIQNSNVQNKFNAEICELILNNERILLVKPQTFMNNSGVVIKKIISYYQKSLNPSIPQLLNYLYVVHDDLDIPLGEYKIQFGKGPKNHNGILSIEKELKTKDFWRVRVGIAGEYYKQVKMSRDKSMAEDYVLKPFGKKEKEVLDGVIKEVVGELLEMMCHCE